MAMAYREKEGHPHPCAMRLEGLKTQHCCFSQCSLLVLVSALNLVNLVISTGLMPEIEFDQPLHLSPGCEKERVPQI